MGDAVFGQATGCLGTAAVTDGRTLAAAPPQLGACAAAAAPTVFLTADACLRGAARLGRGQTVLIHAATGESYFNRPTKYLVLSQSTEGDPENGCTPCKAAPRMRHGQTTLVHATTGARF